MFLVEAVMVVCLTGSEVMVFSMMDKCCVDDGVFEGMGVFVTEYSFRDVKVRIY